MEELTNWLDSEVYRRLDHTLFFGHLPGFRRSGQGYVAHCPNPSHPDRHPSFWMPIGRPLGYCFGCGHLLTWWDVLEQRGLRGRAVIEELARLAGVPPLACGDPDRARRDLAEARAVEEWWQGRREALWRPEGQDVLAYLRSRGYRDEWVREMDLGIYPGPATQIPGGLRLPPPEYRLLIPTRSRGGRILGFAGRRLDTGEPKYRYSQGLVKSALLWGQHRLRQGEVPVVVEGVLDAESLYAAGLEGIVALGGAQASAEQVRLLAQHRRVILALDADQPGQAGAERLALELVRRGVRTYVAADLGGAKDPDELLRVRGADAVREALRRAEAAPKWLARRLLGAAGETDQERDAALERVLDLAEALTRVDPIAARQVLSEAAAVTGLGEAALAEAVERLAERRREEYRRRRWEVALAEARRAAEEGEHERIPAVLRQAEQEIAAASEPVPEPADPVALERRLADFPQGLALPWAALDRLVRVDPGGMTVIGAATSAGKSTMIYNLVLTWLERYPVEAIVIWTGEIVAALVWARLTSIRAGVPLGEVIRQHREGLFSSEVLAARRELTELAEGRFYVLDAPLAADELAARVRAVARRQEVAAVLVDYLQMLAPPAKLDGGRYGTREQEVTATAKALHELAVELNTAVVAAAQLSRNNFQYRQRPRLTDLRESGGIEQYSQMVLGLWHSGMARADAAAAEPAVPDEGWYWTPDTDSSPEADAAVAMAASHGLALLEVSILKSRWRGHVSKAVPLALDGAAGRILDLPAEPGTAPATAAESGEGRGRLRVREVSVLGGSGRDRR